MQKITLNKKKLRKLEPSKDPFASLVRSIIFQQLSTKAASSIHTRFLALFPKKSPTPKRVLALSDVQFKSCGVSNQKAGYLRDLAQKFLDGTIQPKLFPTMTDEEIKEHLVQVKGIGPWTADMFLIFALNRPDILPIGDLAIKKGFQKVFGLRSVLTEKRMRELAKPYGGKRTYLSLYLWQSLDDN